MSLLINSGKFNNLIESIQIDGNYLGRKAYYFNVLGNRTTFVDTTSLHDVCEFLTATQTLVPVTSADTLEIISTSINDAPLGTGARTVKVTYLDVNGILTESPDIALNGIASVPAGFVATGILWMEVTSGGTSEVSSGNILLRRTNNSTTFEQITAGRNKSLSGRIIIPKGFTGYLVGWNASAVQGNFDVRIRATVTSLNRTINPRFLFQDRSYLGQNENTVKDLNLLKYPELSRIKISGMPSATNGRIDVSFSIIMIANN